MIRWLILLIQGKFSSRIILHDITCRQPHPKPCVTQSKWTWSGFDIAMSSFASSGNFSKKGEGVFSSRKTKQKHIQQMKITLQIFIYFSYFCRELHYTLHGWNLATISQKEKQQGLSEKNSIWRSYRCISEFRIDELQIEQKWDEDVQINTSCPFQ